MKKVFNYLIIFFLLTGMACSNDDDNGNETIIGYSGKDITGQVTVVRDAETKQAVLHVNTNNRWELYAGTAVENIDLNRTLLAGDKEGEYNLTVDADKRYIFQFGTNEGQVLLAEKLLPIKGAYNFRDMGGIKNKENRFVRWGKLFRTDEMNKLTDEDLKYITSTGLKTVVDFRTKGEKEGAMGGLIPPAPDKLPSSVKNTHDFEIAAGNIFSDEMLNKIRNGASKEELVEVMKDTYSQLVSNSDYVKAYKDFFAQIQNEANLPVSYHCSAGKDRTGVAAMLIYSALDVDKEVIMEDYLLSKQYIAGKYDSYLKIYPAIAPLVTVDRVYLEAVYKTIEEKYGSMNTFLTKELAIDIDKMKELYLY
ncbi:tyrosine-protein phosphatase [Prevotella sp. 10(H)]|uniref:tyrosine-protein phosphatase n=1 Tax=Prevotella sp. 10(H) TaxID=1158294 RepID=UPI00056BDAD6|nr:tyrosine-protein phosphatase [Prevotella sp. 10(H)]